MTHAAFILPAYALTIGGLAALLVHSWLAMRRAESDADEIRSRRR